MKQEFEHLDSFPVLGFNYRPHDYALIDLSIDALTNQPIVTHAGLLNYITETLIKKNAKLAWGGYLEKRNLYQSSILFQNDSSPRNIHLGIDLWANAGTPIFAPLNGVIHSFAYNKNVLDYGYTLILKHENENQIFHTLYGHLSAEFYSSWQEGRKINIGQQISTIGKKEENGGWLPHLHFQIIRNIEDYKGDYPGVCSESRLAYYKKNCPDPYSLCIPKYKAS